VGKRTKNFDPDGLFLGKVEYQGENLRGFKRGRKIGRPSVYGYFMARVSKGHLEAGGKAEVAASPAS